MKPEYSVATAPLHRGVTLIEASAGTGKTYTIAGLFLRFIVEEELEVREILVTTYTVAATAELRDRIRSLLRLALDGVRAGTSGHALIAELLEQPRFADQRTARRLEAALRAFDEAAIHTIHGFCERVLRERALESRALFDAELLADPGAVLREIAEDYWRTHVYPASPAQIAALADRPVNPATLARLLKDTTAHPRLHTEPSPAHRAQLGAEIEARITRFRQHWPEWRAEVGTHLHPEMSWAKKPLRDKIAGLLDLVHLCAGDPAAPVEAYAALDELTCEKLDGAKMARAATPQHPFFDLCSELAELRARFVATMEADFLLWARAELPQRMAARNVVSFDDLLTRLHAALHRDGAEPLIQRVRSQFRAALVDEFQDTDPTQAEIFGRLFARGEHWLFFIGDPKQAIYGFRGADVRTYLDATAGAQEKFRLGTNQRSTRALVAAVNAIFSRASEPFLVRGIDFDEVLAAGRADAEPLRVCGVARAPFHFWLSESDTPLTVGAAMEELPPRVAAEIARLLDGRATLGGSPLVPRDFAVLTLSNRQAGAIRDALGKAGVPSVLLSDGSVFESDEAADLRTLLSAIVEPARHGLLRAALATALFARSAAEIDALTVEEREWEKWLLRFQRWQELWRESGFMRMFRALLRDGGVRPRLLARPDGERALTNLLHLAELLHQTATAQRLAPAALVQWLGERQRDESAPAEEDELRLERDDDAVKIVTVHKSKGLEYNVVICPFAWGHAELRKPERPRFHDAAHGLTLDLHWPRTEASEQAALREKLEEQTRLLYVAMTRARHECHFVWGRFHKHDLSAGNWLLHPPATFTDPLTALADRAATLTPQTVREEIAQLAAAHPGAIDAGPLPSADAAPLHPRATPTVPLAAREFRSAIDRSWRISSFTSLTEHRDAEQPDYDRAPAIGEAAETGAAPLGIHAFPAGKTAGVCLHAIFEHLDFTQPDTIEPLVAKHLAAHGFSAAEWREPVADCVRRTLLAPLTLGMTLADIPPSARLTELEFHFPVARIEAAALTALLRDAGVERLSFDPRRGLLKGFIDLVFEHEGRFFIVDWKSNRLGADASAYGQPALKVAMWRQHYGLQYHLYTVALHRYLQLRLGAGYDYEQHFGGVFYLFLRGIDAHDSELGIFRGRPPLERIVALEAHFAG